MATISSKAVTLFPGGQSVVAMWGDLRRRQKGLTPDGYHRRGSRSTLARSPIAIRRLAHTSGDAGVGIRVGRAAPQGGPSVAAGGLHRRGLAGADRGLAGRLGRGPAGPRGRDHAILRLDLSCLMGDFAGAQALGELLTDAGQRSQDPVLQRARATLAACWRCGSRGSPMLSEHWLEQALSRLVTAPTSETSSDLRSIWRNSTGDRAPRTARPGRRATGDASVPAIRATWPTTQALPALGSSSMRISSRICSGTRDDKRRGGREGEDGLPLCDAILRFQ